MSDLINISTINGVSCTYLPYLLGLKTNVQNQMNMQWTAISKLNLSIKNISFQQQQPIQSISLLNISCNSINRIPFNTFYNIESFLSYLNNNLISLSSIEISNNINCKNIQCINGNITTDTLNAQNINCSLITFDTTNLSIETLSVNDLLINQYARTSYLLGAPLYINSTSLFANGNATYIGNENAPLTLIGNSIVCTSPLICTSSIDGESLNTKNINTDTIQCLGSGITTTRLISDTIITRNNTANELIALEGIDSYNINTNNTHDTYIGNEYGKVTITNLTFDEIFNCTVPLHCTGTISSSHASFNEMTVTGNLNIACFSTYDINASIGNFDDTVNANQICCTTLTSDDTHLRHVVVDEKLIAPMFDTVYINAFNKNETYIGNNYSTVNIKKLLVEGFSCNDIETSTINASFIIVDTLVARNIVNNDYSSSSSSFSEHITCTSINNNDNDNNTLIGNINASVFVKNLDISGNDTCHCSVSFECDSNISALNGFFTNDIVAENGYFSDILINGFSDERLKIMTDVITQEYVDKLYELQCFKYLPNNDEFLTQGMKVPNFQNERYGLSAQEVLTRFPELVHMSPLYKNEYYSVHYEGFIPILIQAYKSLKDELSALRATCMTL
jgi:hypothetical protein